MEPHRLHHHYATTGNVNMTMGSGKGTTNANSGASGSHRSSGSAEALKSVKKKVESQGLRKDKKKISADNPG